MFAERLGWPGKNFNWDLVGFTGTALWRNKLRGVKFAGLGVAGEMAAFPKLT